MLGRNKSLHIALFVITGSYLGTMNQIRVIGFLLLTTLN